MTPPDTSLSDPAFRAGQIGCACPTDAEPEAITDNRLVFTIAFGLAVLAQALTLTVLPEQGRLLAPTTAGVGLPYALLLTGAVVASFPATLLIDAFSRRAAFGLGASLGVAGGALCAFAAVRNNFFALCLGAFWLGLAQGFALFYRHVAAQSSARAALTVFGGGALAAVATPLAIFVAGDPAKTLLTAAALHTLALAVVIRLPHRRNDPVSKTFPPHSFPEGFVVATLFGALAWGVMGAGMMHGPLTLAACSATPMYIGGAMGWHLASMYAPAALAARWPAFFPTPGALIAGLLLALLGGVAVYAGATIGSVTAGLIAIGVGWSIVNVGCLRQLHAAAAPSRSALAAHDFCVLAAAVAGALL
jgi:hypothetical protein